MTNINVNRPVDEYLKFIQQNFNTDSTDFKDVVKVLNDYSKLNYVVGRNEKADKERIKEAVELKNRLGNISILKDGDKYNKFNKLGNLDLSTAGIIQAYNVIDDLIYEIDVARNWIDDYNKFVKEKVNPKNMQQIYSNIHEELILLGKSILGRAIELTPLDTGELRESGILVDFGSYIIIAFTAPYASYVHENMSINHPYHVHNPNCGGRAKFLEIALQEFFPNRSVWTEVHGFEGVMVKISINPQLEIKYSHYN